ncbi:Calcium-activated potassium channel subunit alpha-1 like [Heracleum sosnowskyi]|uniref:Calcium-activated potassium channel subunit alpha-1 like n=1 Tax=Heracleum sosnowskyi TaxID=360622 RepID=A0AAD8H0K6_9APIA|nr:Calcium-activated potassium channel subunit alpha-1 like [Heracleum sosnowskyi]
MAIQLCTNSPLTLNSPVSNPRSPIKIYQFQPLFRYSNITDSRDSNILISIRCSSAKPTEALRTCKNCKAQFDPAHNDPRSCRYHTAHFGGETKRKFESVHSGGTMSTPDAGKISQYWHCCGSEDPFDLGCTAAPHSSYDD